jgi:hypothetical protein
VCVCVEEPGEGEEELDMGVSARDREKGICRVMLSVAQRKAAIQRV